MPTIEEEKRGDKDDEGDTADCARDNIPFGGRFACAVVGGGEGRRDLRENLGDMYP